MKPVWTLRNNKILKKQIPCFKGIFFNEILFKKVYMKEICFKEVNLKEIIQSFQFPLGTYSKIKPLWTLRNNINLKKQIS